MSIEVADIVQSLAGHDSGKWFLVIKTEDSNCYLVDGKIRKMESPKRKKDKHVLRIRKASEELALKIRNGESLTNKEIRKEIHKQCGTEFSDQEEIGFGKI